MLIALTRAVPPSINRCELSHVAREPIDVAQAEEQHRRYEHALETLGCLVERIAPEPELPDSVFVEDTAVVVDEIAIVTRPGAESRRDETRTMAKALGRHRSLAFIREPGTLDGGDVLRRGSRLYVGLSARSNAEGARQLAEHLAPYGYNVRGADMRGCLHLKSAVTQVGEQTILCNPDWIDPAMFEGVQRVDVHPDEPFAGNALLIGGIVLFPSAFPRTAERLIRAGIAVRMIDAGELAKAEGGLTCCSVIFGERR